MSQCSKESKALGKLLLHLFTSSPANDPRFDSSSAVANAKQACNTINYTENAKYLLMKYHLVCRFNVRRFTQVVVVS